MSDLPDREAYSPRFAVTHELTEEGLRIKEDQVVTADAVTGLPIGNPPLGEIVRASPVMTEEEVIEAEPPPEEEEEPVKEGPAEEEPLVEEEPIVAEEGERPVEPQSFGQSF